MYFLAFLSVILGIYQISDGHNLCLIETYDKLFVIC